MSMEERTFFSKLREIKLSIIANAEDVLWMRTGGATVCEEIDDMLLALGASEEELELDYETTKI